MAIDRVALPPGVLHSLERVRRSSTTHLQRLASGLRVNGAADDAAALAISFGMTAKIRSSSQALRNANDGISLVQIADGSLHYIQSAIQRSRELAVAAANGTLGGTERTYLNNELLALVSEIDRIAKTTKYNGLNLLDGSLAAPTNLTASVVQLSTIASTETLTFDGPMFEGLGTSDRQVTLTVGMTQSDVIDAINNSLVGSYMTASTKAGRLTLAANSPTGMGTFSVSSNKTAQADQSGIGTTTLVTLYDNPLASGTAPQVTASVSQTSTISANETLTFGGALFESLSTAEKQVTLSSGISQETVVSTINSSVVGNLVTASVSNGLLVLKARSNDGIGTFEVVSNRAAAANQSGIGNSLLVGLAGDSDGTTAASVAAGTNQTSTLNKAETLTFTGALFGSVSVDLNKGNSQATVVSTINASDAGKYLTASVAGGALTITSKVSGAIGTFTVESDRDPATNQTGFSKDPAAGLGSDAATSVTGTAQVTASVAQASPLDLNEDLTFGGALFRGLSGNDTEVSLSKNDTLSTVIATINSSVVGQLIQASNVNGFLALTARVAGAEGTFWVTSDKSAASDSTGIGTSTSPGVGGDRGPKPLLLQVGSFDDDADRLEISFGAATAAALGLTGADISTVSGALSFLGTADSALETVSDLRSQLGGSYGRIVHAVNYLSELRLELTDGHGRLVGTDVAMTAAEHVGGLIRLRSGTAVLTQARRLMRQSVRVLG